MKLLLGTSNKGKIIEVRESLASLPVTIITPDAVNIVESPHESGETFAANAIQKAHFYYDRAKIPTVADDSGIIVDALKNELGIHTRRWGPGPTASDEEWIRHFLDRMKKEKNKRATFLCTIAHVDHDGQVHVFEGTCNGRITEKLEADYLPSLPISACFVPDGQEYVFSALSLEQKNSTSHRGRALMKLREHLRQSGEKSSA